MIFILHCTCCYKQKKISYLQLQCCEIGLMDSNKMEVAVELELCILRAVSSKDYQCVVERNCGMDGNSVRLLQAIMQQSKLVQLGQTIPACDIFPAALTVVDLAPATAGVLCDVTTLIVLPPTRDGELEEVCETARTIECNSKEAGGNGEDRG
ncbi:putative peroxisome assembly protein [Trypanosoma conorhini]|uniref:Putative peroxisome assembly protein n=1 Tax=Trypanosoma conorhini TaxID=83891 RepID=A0A422PH26_9TRYP|nr:putative peroxisome assembly protein [Trypanosoma conorhini]RNF17032.1 putative peroxisome assembly protein [Trypanosoma conorhini]